MRTQVDRLVDKSSVKTLGPKRWYYDLFRTLALGTSLMGAQESFTALTSSFLSLVTTEVSLAPVD